MKKMKYLLDRTKRQKIKIENSKRQESQYQLAMKNEAIKSLQDFERDWLNRTQLNITLTSTQRFSSQYRSRSEQKESMRRTGMSNQTKAKTTNHKSEQVNFEASSLNVRKLMRIRTEVEQKQADKLRNPFYKIQKMREMPKKYSMPEKIQENVNNQHNLVNRQGQLKQAQQKQDKIFISWQKKEWYFSSRKFRCRTVQRDQAAEEGRKGEEGESNMSQSLFRVNKSGQETSDRKSMCEQEMGVQGVEVLQLQDSQNVEENGFKSRDAKQPPQGQQASKLRERSLTVKYNEIKDYFERKYNRGSELEEEEGGYEVQKFGFQ